MLGIEQGMKRARTHRMPCAVIVDRDPDVGKTLLTCLAPELQVEVALSAARAATLLDRMRHVDIAFVDLDLPDQGGQQLLQRLAAWPQAIRVLLGQPAAARCELPNRHLAHLIMAKPVCLRVVQALKRATLTFPGD